MFYNVVLRGSEIMRMNHLHTDHIALNRENCQACEKCVEACPRGVLGMISLFGLHKHALIRQAGKCKGCLACVRVCTSGALHELAGREA